MAKRLSRIEVRFRGPHTPQLFELLHVNEHYTTHYDHTAIGTGESRAVAAARAISHLCRVADLPRNLVDDIRTHVQIQLPPNAEEVEAQSGLFMYCIIAIGVEDA